MGAFHPGQHQSESRDKDGREHEGRGGRRERQRDESERRTRRRTEDWGQCRFSAEPYMAVGATAARSAPLHPVVRCAPLTAPHLFRRLRRAYTPHRPPSPFYTHSLAHYGSYPCRLQVPAFADAYHPPHRKRTAAHLAAWGIDHNCTPRP